MSAGIAIITASVINCPRILACLRPIERRIPTSLRRALIHSVSKRASRRTEKLKLPQKRRLAILYMPEIDCSRAG